MCLAEIQSDTLMRAQDKCQAIGGDDPADPEAVRVLTIMLTEEY